MTLAVFILSLITGYFFYSSYQKYQDSKKLLNYISFSNVLSNLLINISNEKIDSNLNVDTKKTSIEDWMKKSKAYSVLNVLDSQWEKI